MAIVKAQESASSSSSSSSSSSPPPPPPPPSLSSSTSESSDAYDVFLSFRGEDTRNNFTDHLYNALVNKGFRTFRDKEGLGKGKGLKPELDKAIEQSRVSIIVLSENYASSTWCLDELVMICDRMKTPGHDVLPVFYHLSPSEVRKQEYGRTAEALANYEVHPVLKEKVEGWKAALKEIGYLSGFVADGYESVLIQDITKWVGNKVIRKPFYLPKLIGMDTQAKNIIKWLQDDSSKFISGGICGMGGIGKTTIAQFVYNENYKSFDAFCFIADVREMSKQSKGLVILQRQLLSCILNDQHKEIYNVNEGMRMIKEAVSHKRVLLVLDDVDHVDQLNALCGMEDWFCRGSKVVITTRDESLLKHCGEAFKVKELGNVQSVELFRFYAFREDSPPTKGYGEHIKRVVQLCGGLPLALQVIGSSLYDRDVSLWASQVKKLEDIPHKDILDKLKISYDCLQDEIDKIMFLDIACFFVGYDMNYTIKVLDGILDSHADVSIQNLIERHLLRIDYRNKLMMHQVVQDMGRNIVRQESPEKAERSRLWRHKDAYDVLERGKGTQKIWGLALDMRIKEDGDTLMEHVYEESLRTASPRTFRHSFFNCFGWFSTMDLKTSAFEKMENLRLLMLNYTHLTGCYDKFPKKLVWLCWHGFPLKSLPVELTLKNLVALDLRHSKLEEVWTGHKILISLKILDLSYSEMLVKTPNFRGVPNLEKLILADCVRLIRICKSIKILQKLNLLDLTNCKNLRELPSNMHKLGSLETLMLSGCSTLFAAGYVKSAKGKWWRTSLLLPWALPTRGPEMLWASLPHFLLTLNLSFCKLSDDSLPSTLSNLSRLKHLDLSRNLFRSLPDCIKSLSRLQRLALASCTSLDSILGLPSNIESLHLGATDDIPLRRITFESTPDRLNEISIYGCNDLVEIEGILKREPIEKVDRMIIKNLGIDIQSIKNLQVTGHLGHVGYKREPIQGIYEFGIFNTFIPGGKIPSCFSERKKGSSMSFTVPWRPKFRIQCLNIYSVYVAGPAGQIWGGIEINNKTKNLTWVYIPTYFSTPKEDREEEMTWFSQWNFGNQLEGGDKIVVSVLSRQWLEVKECGISIMYEEEEEDNGVVPDDNNDKPYFHWNEVVGGDLSRLQLRSGTYFLHRIIYPYYEIFEHIINIEEMQKLKVRCHMVDPKSGLLNYSITTGIMGDNVTSRYL